MGRTMNHSSLHIVQVKDHKKKKKTYSIAKMESETQLCDRLVCFTVLGHGAVASTY
jgi:hypothetical protein